MPLSATLKRLGFGTRDRVLVIHADDVGMCHSTLSAFQELTSFGLVSSGAAMPPCPAFAATASWARGQPAVDLGVHLTLTSEWKSYRWSPLSGAAGLCGAGGFLHADVPSLVARASPREVYMEITAQLNHARSLGLAPTHLDTHMYAAMQPSFFAEYLRAAGEAGLPAFVVRNGPLDWPNRTRQVEEWEERGFPVFDWWSSFRWQGDPADGLIAGKALVDSIQPGLNCLLIHAATDPAELRSIVPQWRYLVRDYQVFTSPILRDYVRSRGITVIGYGQLQTAR